MLVTWVLCEMFRDVYEDERKRKGRGGKHNRYKLIDFIFYEVLVNVVVRDLGNLHV